VSKELGERLMPVRLQLSRRKGFDLQAASVALNGLPAINVARPGPLGNPFIVGKDGSRAECVHLFRMMTAGYLAVTTHASVESQRSVLNYIFGNMMALRNCNVACWCPLDACCHGDVVLEIVNRRRGEAMR
jgi:hypothetical protein